MPLMPNTPQTTMTKPHRQLIKVLEDWGYEIVEEVSFPPYSVDVYLPELHVAVEADGPQHSQKHDEKRDLRLLSEYGLPVLRVSSKDLAKGVEQTLAALLRHTLGIAFEDSRDVRRALARNGGWDGE